MKTANIPEKCCNYPENVLDNSLKWIKVQTPMVAYWTNGHSKQISVAVNYGNRKRRKTRSITSMQAGWGKNRVKNVCSFRVVTMVVHAKFPMGRKGGGGLNLKAKWRGGGGENWALHPYVHHFDDQMTFQTIKNVIISSLVIYSAGGPAIWHRKHGIYAILSMPTKNFRYLVYLMYKNGESFPDPRRHHLNIYTNFE